jgi:hypothetical protein
MAVVHRWVERGLIPASGSGRLTARPFTGFAPLQEQDLPVVSTEAVD